MTQTILYALSSSDSFSMFQWNGEGVVYVVSSGDTHLLDKFSTSILQYLSGEPLTIDELVERTNKTSTDDTQLKNVLSILAAQGIVLEVSS